MGGAGYYVYFITWPLHVYIVTCFQSLVQTLEEYCLMPPESNCESNCVPLSGHKDEN